MGCVSGLSGELRGERRYSWAAPEVVDIREGIRTSYPVTLCIGRKLELLRFVSDGTFDSRRSPGFSSRARRGSCT